MWNVIGWSYKSFITWLREHAKLRRTGKHPQSRNGWRTERTFCSDSVHNNCIFGCFDTRLCKLVSLYPYDIVVNLIRFSGFLFQEIVSSQKGKTLPYWGNQKIYTLWHTLCSCLNVKKLLPWNRLVIWRLRNCNRTRTHNRLVCKQTLNHLVKLTKWLSCVVSTWNYNCTVNLTECSYHVTYVFQSESTLYSCLNVKELLSRNRRVIWLLSDCNEAPTLMEWNAVTCMYVCISLFIVD